jgi:hypothetical protein
MQMAGGLQNGIMASMATRTTMVVGAAVVMRVYFDCRGGLYSRKVRRDQQDKEDPANSRKG